MEDCGLQFYMLFREHREFFHHDSFFYCVLEGVFPWHLAVLVWILLSRKSWNTVLRLEIDCKICLEGSIRILNHCLGRLAIDFHWFRAQFDNKISTSESWIRTFMGIAIVKLWLVCWDSFWTWSFFWLIHALLGCFFIRRRAASTSAIYLLVVLAVEWNNMWLHSSCLGNFEDLVWIVNGEARNVVCYYLWKLG